MKRPLTSGFCNTDNPPESHERCAGCGCDCHTTTAVVTAVDPVATVAAAVTALEDALPALMDACTDPQALDMAELLADLQDARRKLQALEQQVETATAKAMLADRAEAPGLIVERYRTADRKAWDHEAWQRDVRDKVLQAHGLKGAQGVLDANGEVLDPGVLHEVLRAVEGVHASAAPKTSKTSGLRAYGLDPADYCETSPGRWAVKVQRIADETKGEVQTDAA